MVIDRSSFPNANDEYTPEQRNAVNAELKESAKGPFYGPFDTADDMIADVKKKLKAGSKTPKLTKRR